MEGYAHGIEVDMGPHGDGRKWGDVEGVRRVVVRLALRTVMVALTVEHPPPLDLPENPSASSVGGGAGDRAPLAAGERCMPGDGKGGGVRAGADGR